jgi:hypothetical protein
VSKLKVTVYHQVSDYRFLTDSSLTDSFLFISLVGVAAQQGRSWGGGNIDTRQNIMDNRPVAQQERFSAVQQDNRGTFGNTITPALVSNVQPSIFVPAVPNTAQMIISNQGLAAARQQEARFDAYKSIQTGSFRRY